MTKEEAIDLVYDLVEATREFERRSGSRYYRIEFEEAREKVIAALCQQSRDEGVIAQ